MALTGKLSLSKIKKHVKAKKHAETCMRPKSEQKADIEKYLSDKYQVWNEYLPLEIGIYGKLKPDVLDNVKDVSCGALRSVLSAHVRDKRYLANVTSLNKRYGLDGACVGDVEKKHIEYTKEVLLK